MNEREQHSIELKDVRVKTTGKAAARVKFVTSDGSNSGILLHRKGSTSAVVLVGGARGGFNGPASIYQDMAKDMMARGIASLRLDYRVPNSLDDCVLDVLVAIEFLKSLDVERVGLVGWSFGGAVVIDAGIVSDEVRAVATVASQTYGTGLVHELAPKPLLLIHGTADPTLPPTCSEDIYSRAGEPKELVLYEGADHGVDQKRGEMLRKVEEFLVQHLQG